MSFAVEHPNQDSKHRRELGFDREQADLVRAELDRILDSRFFRNAVRSRQFLEFVVTHKIQGNCEQLKERTIGTEVFHRPPGYATGDDPVVRVQAGEVRRRLQQYYQQTGSDGPVRIELPVGSYAPHIRWMPSDRIADQEITAPSPHPTVGIQTVESKPVKARRYAIP